MSLLLLLLCRYQQGIKPSDINHIFLIPLLPSSFFFVSCSTNDIVSKISVMFFVLYKNPSSLLAPLFCYWKGRKFVGTINLVPIGWKVITSNITLLDVHVWHWWYLHDITWYCCIAVFPDSINPCFSVCKQIIVVMKVLGMHLSRHNNGSKFETISVSADCYLFSFTQNCSRFQKVIDGCML